MRPCTSPTRRAVLTLAVSGAFAFGASGALAGIGPGEACAPAASSGVPPDRLKRLARGFNLTGWVDQDEPRRPDPEALRLLFSERGLTHVRLPLTLEAVSQAFVPRAQMARRLKEVDAAVAELLRIGYAVSLDLHPGSDFNRLHRTEPERALSILLDLWRSLASRYAGRPADRVLFELLNEPGVAAALWREQAGRLVGAIRAVAPAHTIVVGPANFQRFEALEAFDPLPDQNIVYAIHFYDPMAFTHQGMTWVGPDEALGRFHDLPFPSTPDDPAVRNLRAELLAQGRTREAAELMRQAREPWTEAAIDASFWRVAAWIVRHRRPVIVNEFGALSFATAPENRARWLGAVRRAAERSCIGWTHWEYADAFGFMRRSGGREIPDPPILDALTR